MGGDGWGEWKMSSGGNNFGGMGDMGSFGGAGRFEIM